MNKTLVGIIQTNVLWKFRLSILLHYIIISFCMALRYDYNNILIIVQLFHFAPNLIGFLHTYHSQHIGTTIIISLIINGILLFDYKLYHRVTCLPRIVLGLLQINIMSSYFQYTVKVKVMFKRLYS